MLTIVFLISLNGTITIHNYDLKKEYSKNSFLGGFIAFFASTCPVCQPIWLIWLGFGSVSAFLSGIGLYIGLLSIILLTISLYYSLKSVSSCPIKK